VGVRGAGDRRAGTRHDLIDETGDRLAAAGPKTLIADSGDVVCGHHRPQAFEQRRPNIADG
jgi:hypothetical protein